MKLRKTVEMSIEEAQDDFCDSYETCGVCPLNKKAPLDCLAWCVAHPHEAASLMGYEVVEDDYTFTIKLCDNKIDKALIAYLEGYLISMWNYVKTNRADLVEEKVGRAQNYAIHAACEAIQVAAMCRKFMEMGG